MAVFRLSIITDAYKHIDCVLVLYRDLFVLISVIAKELTCSLSSIVGMAHGTTLVSVGIY